MARVVGLPRLQALYRRFVGLDLDKGRAAEVLEVAEKKLADLFEAAAERAEAEGRETIRWLDLPLTKGLKETIERYEREREKLNDPRLDPGPIAEYVAKPAHHLALDEEVMEKLPSLAATVLLLIGYVVKHIDPETRKPSKRDIERARRILDLTL